MSTHGPNGPSVDQRLQAHRDRLQADRNRLQATAAAKPSCLNFCAACFAAKKDVVAEPDVVAIGVPVGQPFDAASRQIERIEASLVSSEVSAEEKAEVEEVAAAARSARATKLAFLGIYDMSPTGCIEAGGDGTFNGEARFSPRPCLVCADRRKFSRRKEEDDPRSILAEETRAMMGADSPSRNETGRPRVRFSLPCCGGRPPPERQATRRSAPDADSDTLFGEFERELSDLFSLNCCTARSKAPAAEPPRTGAYKRSVGFEMRNTDI